MTAKSHYKKDTIIYLSLTSQIEWQGSWIFHKRSRSKSVCWSPIKCCVNNGYGWGGGLLNQDCLPLFLFLIYTLCPLFSHLEWWHFWTISLPRSSSKEEGKNGDSRWVGHTLLDQLWSQLRTIGNAIIKVLENHTTHLPYQRFPTCSAWPLASVTPRSLSNLVYHVPGMQVLTQENVIALKRKGRRDQWAKHQSTTGSKRGVRTIVGGEGVGVGDWTITKGINYLYKYDWYCTKIRK